MCSLSEGHLQLGQTFQRASKCTKKSSSKYVGFLGASTQAWIIFKAHIQYDGGLGWAHPSTLWESPRLNPFSTSYNHQCRRQACHIQSMKIL